jgi:hypothetical protein
MTAKTVKFNERNPQDKKRLEWAKSVNFGAWVKRKIDEELAGIDPAASALEKVSALEYKVAELADMKYRVEELEKKMRDGVVAQPPGSGGDKPPKKKPNLGSNFV